MDLRIATCTPLPEPDPDQALLVSSLQREGLRVEVVPWNRWDFEDDAPVLIRSTWDYYRALPAFLTWIDTVAERGLLANPADVVRENAHKRYLLSLAAAGHPVVPTLPFERGTIVDSEAVRRELATDKVVVKPAVSAGSYETHVLPIEEAAGRIQAAVHQRDTLVQPYLRAVETVGERSLIFVGGTFTHAMRKAPRYASDAEHVTGPFPIEEDELRIASALMAPYAASILYGRVDLVRDEAGLPCVMELELVEPSLFLSQHPPALARFVQAILRYVEDGP